MPEVVIVIVLVTYRDAWFELDGPEPREDYIVQVCGWVVKEGLRFLSVASEKLPDPEDWRAVTHVPNESVISVENLKVG